MYPVELAPGDRLLLCSDGLTGMVQADTIAATLRREDDPTRAAIQLVDAANLAGGEDNITVVVVAVTDEAPVRAVAEPVAPIELAGRRRRSRQPASGAPAPPRRAGRRSRPPLGAPDRASCSGVAVGAVGWYARRSYYVGLHQGHVTVFKGVPGGLAGWNPTVERRTALAPADLRPADLAAVKDDKTFSSLADADAFVARIRGARHDDDDRPRPPRPPPRRRRRAPRRPCRAAAAAPTTLAPATP